MHVEGGIFLCLIGGPMIFMKGTRSALMSCVSNLCKMCLWSLRVSSTCERRSAMVDLFFKICVSWVSMSVRMSLRSFFKSLMISNALSLEICREPIFACCAEMSASCVFIFTIIAVFSSLIFVLLDGSGEVLS